MKNGKPDKNQALKHYLHSYSYSQSDAYASAKLLFTYKSKNKDANALKNNHIIQGEHKVFP